MKRAAAALAACLVLSSCGGGGDSSVGIQPGAGPNGVTLTVTGPARFDADVYERQPVPSVAISGRLSGNLSLINGATLYLVVVVPDQFLFSATPVVNIDPDGLGGNIQLVGVAPPDGPRTYTGIMTLHACLDAGCVRELQVANADIPYSVRVRTGLKPALSAVTLETSFGTLASPVTMPVTLPEGVLSWEVTPFFGHFGAVRADKAPDGSSNIVFSATEIALPEDDATIDVFIRANVPGDLSIDSTVSLTSTTHPSSVPFAFQHATAFTVQQGANVVTDTVESDALFPGGDADRFSYVSTSYSWPAAASANSLRDQWLQASLLDDQPPRTPSSRYRILMQALHFGQDGDLPVGHYVATMHFTYAPESGTPTDASYDVTLDIEP